MPFNLPPTSPLNPRWMWLLLLFSDTTGGKEQGAIMMLPYIPDGDPAVGDQPQNYLWDFCNQFAFAITAAFPATTSLTVAGFYWMTALGMQVSSASPNPFNPTGGNFGGMWPAFINGLIRKRTARYPLGRPRVWIPFVPFAFSDDGVTLNSLGMTGYNTFAAQLNTNLSSQGRQFFPASWSYKSNLLEPALSFFTVPKLARVMRRGIFRGSDQAIFMNPFVWNF